MPRFSGWEILVVLVIVLLLFGPGRIVKLAKELGSSISAFRTGLQDKPEDKPKDDEKPEDKIQ